MQKRFRMYLQLTVIFMQHVLCSTKTNKIAHQICNVHSDSQNATTHLTTICRTCSTCPAGQLIKEHCSSTSDTVCETCPPGTFSKADNSRTCKACSTCSDTNQVIQSNCSKTDDAVCSCSGGTFLQQGVCRKCTSCAAGYYVTKRCSQTGSTVCSPCRPGSFTLKINTAEYCEACSICRRNHVYINRCTSTKNTKCGGCKEGYYENENTGDCEQCSYCYPERPGYTFQVEACLQIKADINWTCMPVTKPPPPRSDSGDTTSTSPSLPGYVEVTTSENSILESVNLHQSETVIITIVVVSVLGIFVLVVIVSIKKHQKGKTGNDGIIIYGVIDRLKRLINRQFAESVKKPSDQVLLTIESPEETRIQEDDSVHQQTKHHIEIVRSGDDSIQQQTEAHIEIARLELVAPVQVDDSIQQQTEAHIEIARPGIV